MFCPKCGAQIEASNLHCPKCGAMNPNYKEPESAQEKGNSGFGIKMDIAKVKVTPKKAIIGSVIACLVIGITVSLFKLGNSNSFNMDRVTYSPNGLYSFYDRDKNVNFISGIDIISLKGPASSARTSPNHANRVVLSRRQNTSSV